MAKPVPEIFDIEARDDPLVAEYRQALELLKTAEWPQGLQNMEALANRGSTMSTLFIADALRSGWLYDQDLPGAEDWYRVAVGLGSARALFGLGLTCLLMDRFSEAIEDLEAAIARHYPPAYNALAGMYFRGDGVPVDRQRALDLWRKGGSLGHVPAKRNLVQQCLWGRYGFWGRVEGAIRLLPVAIEIVATRETYRYSDRLR